MLKISAVILTKNEEKNIAGCIKSVAWCDEVLIVDDHSTDRTLKIAQGLGAKIFSRSLKGDFAAQRNFALKRVSGAWILFVDGDERVTEELAEEIRSIIAQTFNKLPNGFYFRRKDFFGGRWLGHGEPGNIKLLRLAKRDAGRWQRSVDEVWKVKGETRVLRNFLLHYSHPNLDEFLSSINELFHLNDEPY